MTALTDAGRALIEALIEAPLAWSSPRELARRTRTGPDEVLDLVAVLEEAGWLEGWDREVDAVVTLTPWAAELLGVRIVEVGESELPRWARADQPDPPPPRARGVFVTWQEERAQRAIDPRPTPIEAHILEEELDGLQILLARYRRPRKPQEDGAKDRTADALSRAQRRREARQAIRRRRKEDVA